MTSFHPDTQYLVEYAAGSLSIGLSICVAAHIEHCAECKQQVHGLNSYGAAMIEGLEPANVSARLFEKVLANLDTEQKAAPRVLPYSSEIPKAISKLVPNGFDDLPWKKYGKDLETCRLSVGEDKYEVSLIRMQAGGTINQHTHKGLEMTVVLKGVLSDKYGVYKAGDFSVCNIDDEHQPMATQDMECICLTAVEAPIHFKGWRGIVNPFLNFQPA
jgi:putative transcriptional regulator